jgi:hypothetical protein
MMKISRSRLVVRQDPNATASLAGGALACFGCSEMILTAWSVTQAILTPQPVPLLVPCVRFALGALFVASGWLFLRGRSRVVIDRSHRMVARYLGVGGYSAGGNRTWDLGEFDSVSVTIREKRSLIGGARRCHVVCLKRADGSGLELYWASGADESSRVASNVAQFSGLPYVVETIA